jgi:hypothetical protein
MTTKRGHFLHSNRDEILRKIITKNSNYAILVENCDTWKNKSKYYKKFASPINIHVLVYIIQYSHINSTVKMFGLI